MPLFLQTTSVRIGALLSINNQPNLLFYKKDINSLLYFNLPELQFIANLRDI